MFKSTHYIPFKTIVTREVTRFTRIWVQTLVPPVITVTLYFIIFGQLIGERIGQMQGYSYIQFVIPGLVLMSVITNSYGNVVSSFFSHKFQRFLEELLISPTPNYVILWGFVLGGILRGFVVSILVIIVSMYFTTFQVVHILPALATLIATAIVFSMLGLLNAIHAKNFDEISIIPTFVLTPLTYLGGIFFSIAALPSFWSAVALFNPIFYMVDLFRYCMLGTSDVSPLYGAGLLIALIFILTFTALYLLKYSKKLRS